MKETSIVRSSLDLGRWSGHATIIAGLLWAAGGSAALNSEDLGITMRGPHLVLSLAGLLSLLGLARIGSRYAGADGLAGSLGILLTSAGVVLIIVSKNLPSSISDEAAWSVFYVGGLVLVVGSLLFGIVSLHRRAWLLGAPLVAVGVFAILNVVFLMIPSRPGYVGTLVLPVLVGLAWTALGCALWFREARATVEPSVEAHVHASHS